jgi:hypothetical protein
MEWSSASDYCWLGFSEDEATVRRLTAAEASLDALNYDNLDPSITFKDERLPRH